MPNNERLAGLILRAQGIESLRASATRYHMSLNDVADILDGSRRILVDHAVLADPQGFSYAVALAVASFSADTLPLSFREALRPRTDGTSLRAERLHSGWDLCPDAESYMRGSIRVGAIMDVNQGMFAVKFGGRLTALCTQTCSTREGTFIEGNWYSPVDNNTRGFLRDAFDQGLSRVALEEGTWALIRPIREMGAPILLQSVQTALQMLSDSLPATISGVSRREFRTRSAEETLDGSIIGTA